LNKHHTRSKILTQHVAAQNYTSTVCQFPENDEVLSGQLVSLIGGILAVLAVAARLLGRYMTKILGWDDWSMVITLVPRIARHISSTNG
jgi:hypothetical protein